MRNHLFVKMRPMTRLAFHRLLCTNLMGCSTGFRRATRNSSMPGTTLHSRSSGRKTTAAGVGRVTGFHLNRGVLDAKQGVQFALDPREEGVVTDRRQSSRGGR